MARMIKIEKNLATGLVRAAEAQGLIERRGDGVYGPDWAVIIAELEHVSARDRIAAIKRCARDPESRRWVAPMLGCLDTEDRQSDFIAMFAAESNKTIVCKCGRKFTYASNWQQHLEDGCPGPGTP